MMGEPTFSHLDERGTARMVDVTPKDVTHRRAVARCTVTMRPETVAAITIPLCHPLMIGAVHVDFAFGDDHIAIEASVDTVDRTGVEMEALHACSVAALTIYDMCKSADRDMVIGELAVWHKQGGRSGTYERPSHT
jgi:cyclic pyranopterin phosphate synthase